jgi:hypothetical protein
VGAYVCFTSGSYTQGVSVNDFRTVVTLVVLLITIRGIVARFDARLTIQYGIARLGAVAEQAVVTLAVVRRVVACIGVLVARIDRTAHPVVAIHRRPRFAQIVHTGFLSVAKQTVVAVRVIDTPRALVVLFVTTQRIGARLGAVHTTQFGIARLGAVAEQTVVAVCIDDATHIRSVFLVIVTASDKTIAKRQPTAQKHCQE